MNKKEIADLVYQFYSSKKQGKKYNEQVCLASESRNIVLTLEEIVTNGILEEILSKHNKEGNYKKVIKKLGEKIREFKFYEEELKKKIEELKGSKEGLENNNDSLRYENEELKEVYYRVKDIIYGKSGTIVDEIKEELRRVSPEYLPKKKFLKTKHNHSFNETISR